jgi:uncharacterized membrane protein YqjE
MLAGGALMIWATVPENAVRMPWVLIATPMVPCIGAIVCLRRLQRKDHPPAFAKVRRQVAADLQMLREGNAP